MNDDNAGRHDPGGKVRLALRPGIAGTADFSPCGRYRTALTRTLGRDGPVALWIGANPSTAEADADDPTVGRETGFSLAAGYGTYLKANVMDYRATSPRDLRSEGVVARSPDNLDAIRALCMRADTVVACWGLLHKDHHAYARETAAAVLESGHALHHLGCTKDGHPRHPLYLRKTTPIAPWAQAHAYAGALGR